MTMRKRNLKKNDSSINLTTDQYHIVWCVKYRRYIQTQKER